MNVEFRFVYRFHNRKQKGLDVLSRHDGNRLEVKRVPDDSTIKKKIKPLWQRLRSESTSPVNGNRMKEASCA